MRLADRRQAARTVARGSAGRRLLALLSICGLAHSPAAAVDISGSAALFATDSENLGRQTDLLEQQYSLGLFQRLTPYLSLRFGYQHFDFDSETNQGPDFERGNREPRLELLYTRQRLSARFSLWERTAVGTRESDNFETRSLAANVAWQARRGPGFTLNFRDETNVADVAIFGREIDSQFLGLDAYYNARHWGVTYSFQQNQLDNRVNGLATDQDRHEVRVRAGGTLFDDRLSLAFFSSFGRIERQTEVADVADLAEPVPAVRGLFAVDISPEIGELEPAPELIDGDARSPAAPVIEIGGANTFRNLGLDFGITAPVSRLEISVDSVSGRELLWRIYRSPDNLIWEPVPGAQTSYDDALLRYTVRFPQTTDRYFKAVNVSANTEALVRVTELRALVDVDVDPALLDVESTLYRADAALGFRPAPRVSGSVNVGVSQDEDLSGGFVRRDFSEMHATAGLDIDLTQELGLSFGYRFTDSENLREPVLLRTTETWSSGLTWTPLPTVDAALLAQLRDESEEEQLLRSDRSLRLLVTTDLLPDLRLVSDLELFRLEQVAAGFERDGSTWRERIEARLTPRWTVSAYYARSDFESGEGQRSFDSEEFGGETTWAATGYLTLSGRVSLTRVGGEDTLQQSYNLSYNPGRKLSLSAAFQGSEIRADRRTTTDNVALTYRLNSHLSFFATLSRSTTEQEGLVSVDSRNLRGGIRLFF